MTQLSPYLTFNGNCREAMEFYKQCLGGELILQTVGESPMAAQMPDRAKKNILHACLVKGPIMLMGSDMAGGEGLINGNTISLSLNCSSEEEIRNFFTGLSQGGEILRPLHDFFAGTIGSVTDKFGKNWIFYFEKNTSFE